MYTDMQQWSEIRRRVLTGELSKRAACQEYDIHWETLQKILTHAEPPGYRHTESSRTYWFVEFRKASRTRATSWLSVAEC